MKIKDQLTQSFPFLKQFRKMHLGVMFTGSSWFVFFRLLVRATQLAVFIVAARILSPAQIGLLGMGALILTLVEMASQLGIGQIVVQEENLPPDDFSILWTFQVVRGFLGFLLILLSSPLIAAFFRISLATIFPLLFFFAIMFAVRGLVNPGIFLLQKNWQFRKYITFLLAGGIVGSIAAILFLTYEKSMQGYLLGFLLGDITMVIFSFLFSPITVRFNFDYRRFQHLYQYGRWVTFSALLTYLYMNIDDFVVGRYLGPASLGVYQVAYNVAQMPVTEGMQSVANVAFPVFRRIHEETVKLRRLFNFLVVGITGVTILYCALIVVYGKSLIDLFLGEAWLSVYPVARVLLLWGLLHSVVGMTGPLFMALNKMKTMVAIQLAQTGLLAIFLVPAVKRGGLMEVALVVFLAALLPSLYGLRLAYGYLWEKRRN